MFASKAMRESAGFTQQEVADKLGIRKGRYGDWERETREINLRDACSLADLFGCSLDDLAGREWPRAEARASPALTPPESEVLDAMRSTNDQGRDAIVSVARSMRGARDEGAAPPEAPARAWAG